MKIDLLQLKRYAPYLVPLVIVGLGWFVFVRPTVTESTRVERELEGLRQRAAFARSQPGGPPPAEPAGDPMKAFERQVASDDPSGRLLEELSRLAARTGVHVDAIENGDQGSAAEAGGPAVSGGVMPDPRFALFQTPLKYSPVTLTADADYASLGNFLWQLRDLATVVEIRSLAVTSSAETPGDTAPAPGTVRVTLTVFAYSRTAAGEGA